MDDFKLNAERIIAAQRARDRRAQSPETESNWDSSDPEDDTVTQISSDEEFSVRSTKSHKSTKSNKSSKSVVKTDASKVKSPSKPESATPSKKATKQSSDSQSATKGPARSAVNVFVDRGLYDSEEESQKSTTKKTKKKKEEKPPYDFRNALKDDDAAPSQGPAQRPGRSRKGESYDPALHKTKATPQQEQFPNTGSWDDSDENERALAQMLKQRDGNPSLYNSPRSEVKDEKEDGAQEGGGQKNKKKGWSISIKKKSSEETTKQKEEKSRQKKSPERTRRKEDNPRRGTEVAIATLPKHALKHSEVDLSEGDEKEASQEVISLDFNDQSARYIHIYHHGNTSCHDTRQAQEEVYMTAVADKSERIFRRCAQEIFATLRILVDFFLIFLLEGLRFFAFNIISSLLVGLLTGFGDYFLRPFVTALFNGLCQPMAIFFFNVGVATRTATRPFMDLLRSFLAQAAILVRSFRLVEINWKNGHQSSMEDV